eukprot:m51a1_g12739 hypothetical protein (194) ;mRNA; f:428-1144
MEGRAVGGGRDGAKGERLETPRVRNVCGSTAGAGSGDFHTYRKQRNAEAFRLSRMVAQERREKETKSFEEHLKELADEDEEATSKRRDKRQKKKLAKQQAKIRTKAEELLKEATSSGAAETKEVKAPSEAEIMAAKLALEARKEEEREKSKAAREHEASAEEAHSASPNKEADGSSAEPPSKRSKIVVVDEDP